MALLTALNNIDIQMVVIENGRITHVSNRELADRWGYTEADIDAQPDFLSIIHPDDRSRVFDYYQCRLSGKPAPASYEVGLLTPYGKRIDCEASIAVLTDKGDFRIVAICKEISKGQKMAGKTSRPPELHFYRTIESLPDIVVARHDSNARFVYINSAFEQVLGVRREYVIGKTPGQVTELRSGKFFEDKIKEAALTGRAQQLEYRRMTGASAPAWGLAHIIPHFDNSGKVEYVDVLLRDITAFKETRQRLDETATRLLSILQTIPDMVWLKDANGVYRFCNHEFERFFGAKEADIIGKTDYDFVDAELADFFRSKDKAAIEAGEVCINEEWITMADGQRVLLETRKVPVFSAEGNVCGVLGIGRDITERRQAEDVLQKQEEFIYNALDAIDEGFIVLDKQYRIQLANKAFSEMVNAPIHNLVGRKCFEVAHNFKTPCFESDMGCPVKKTFATGETACVTHRHVGMSGAEKNLELKSFPLLNEDGEVVSAIKIFSDVTEKKRLEEHLTQARKMEAIGTLAGGIAHDFNNMLGVILGHVELALMKTDSMHPAHSHLTQIFNTTEHSANLTRQLLTFARKQVVVPKIIDVNEAVDGMIKMLRRLIGEHIELVWLPESEKLSVVIDPSQVDQILANLCINARDAIADIGKITITARNAVIDETYVASHLHASPGDYVLLSVTDNGCGMDKQTLGRIFDPFFTTKGLGKGTGLGLATVYGIVQQNNGFINVYSEPGTGSTFNIYLPRHHNENDDSVQETHVVPVMEGNETILLVEDEPVLRLVTTELLEGLGYEVLVASTPSEAIRIAMERIGNIDLLVTDLIMPEMNGMELSKSILSISPHLKVLYTSGYPSDVVAQYGILYDKLNFLQKPFSMQDLGEKVREALGYSV